MVGWKEIIPPKKNKDLVIGFGTVLFRCATCGLRTVRNVSLTVPKLLNFKSSNSTIHFSSSHF